MPIVEFNFRDTTFEFAWHFGGRTVGGVKGEDSSVGFPATWPGGWPLVGVAVLAGLAAVALARRRRS